MAPVVVNTVDADGQHGSSRNSFYVAYVLFFLMYMVVLLYGMNVARSIIEEKTSRVFEVLLSTIRPSEVLAGKNQLSRAAKKSIRARSFKGTWVRLG